MDGTVLSQGYFTQPAGTAVAQTLMIPSNFDWVKVWNYTQAGTSAGANSFLTFWQRGMPNGIAPMLVGGAANAVTSALTVANAFTFFDFSNFIQQPLNNGSTGISAISNAAPPVATVGSTAGMSVGAIVRLSSVATTVGANLNTYSGMDFTVGYGAFTGTTFSLDYVNQPGANTTTGNFRVIGYPINLANGGIGWVTTDGEWYPRVRQITNISAAASAVITVSVQHNYQVGDAIRLRFPGGQAVWGQYATLDNYTNLQSSTGPNNWIITAVDTATGNGHNSITINANTTGFAAFAFPAGPQVITPAQVVPFGEDTATAINNNSNILSDATQNVGFIGVTLAAGALLPAGSASDNVYWLAGKSAYSPIPGGIL